MFLIFRENSIFYNMEYILWTISIRNTRGPRQNKTMGDAKNTFKIELIIYDSTNSSAIQLPFSVDKNRRVKTILKSNDY